MKQIKGQYNLKWAVVLRFLRTFIPQLIVIMPIVLKYGNELSEFLPLWTIPVLSFVAAVATAGDKLVRELRKK